MSRDIGLLHPELRKIAREFVNICAAHGLAVTVTETLRSRAEQDALYAQGRTAPGSIVTNVRYPDSAHCWGVAFDFCRGERGREYDDSDGFFARAAALAKPLGLNWGGDWRTFRDKPHLELPRFMPGGSVSYLKKTYAAPENFMKGWEKETEQKRFITIKDIPQMFCPTVRRLEENGILLGDGNADLEARVIDLSEDMVRILVLLDRAGVFADLRQNTTKSK